MRASVHGSATQMAWKRTNPQLMTGEHDAARSPDTSVTWLQSVREALCASHRKETAQQAGPQKQTLSSDGRGWRGEGKVWRCFLG